MTSNLDSPDFTSLGTRAMLSLTQSPLTSVVAGWQSVVCDVPLWSRSLNLLVAGNSYVISLSVSGVTTNFVYLNAVPAYDGGIYYIPAMPVIDAQVTLTWYQVTTAQVSIYAVASDEPISVSVFNPVSPTQATTERLAPYTPKVSPANVGINFDVNLDSTTRAVRVTVDKPNNYTYGKIIGNQSATVYYDGLATSAKFPNTPVPVDNVADTSVQVQVHNSTPRAANVYVALVNVPDFAGSLSITNPLSSNELSPDPSQSTFPNQDATTFDGTIAAGATQSLVAAVAGQQLRLHQLLIMQYTAVATHIAIQETSPKTLALYHNGAAMNQLLLPMLAKVVTRGEGIRLLNNAAAVTGGIAVTLWYSVL